MQTKFLFFIGFLFINNICIAFQESSSSSVFAKASPDTSVFATASAIAQPVQRIFNEEVEATAWKASHDTFSCSSKSLNTLHSDSEQLSYLFPSYSNQIKLDNLTPRQKTALKKLNHLKSFSTDINHIISSYIEKYDKKASEELLNVLKNQSLKNEERLELAKQSIENSADPNYNGIIYENDQYINTPLENAITNYKIPDYDLIKILLDAGANVNVKHVDHRFKNIDTPLTQMIFMSGYFYIRGDEQTTKIFSKIIELLLQHGADPNVWADLDTYPNHRNAELNRAIRFELFGNIWKKTTLFRSFEFHCWSRESPLLIAARFNLSEIVDLLLKFGANPEIGLKNDSTHTFKELMESDIANIYGKIPKVYNEWKEQKINNSIKITTD